LASRSRRKGGRPHFSSSHVSNLRRLQQRCNIYIETTPVTLEQIVRRYFPQADRAFVQESVARQVERTPELYLALYCNDPRSM
jgi:hypothetical protein